MTLIIARIKSKFVAQQTGMGLSQNDLTDERKFKVDFGTLFIDLTYTFGQQFDEFADALSYVIGEVIPAGGWNITGVSVIAYADHNATMHYFRRLTSESDESQNREGWEEIGGEASAGVTFPYIQLSGLPRSATGLLQPALSDFGLNLPVWNNLLACRYNQILVGEGSDYYSLGYKIIKNNASETIVLYAIGNNYQYTPIKAIERDKTTNRYNVYDV